MVHAERLENRLRRGSDARRRVIEPVAALLAGEPPIVDPATARAALAPALWLLELATAGIALTQTGALNRALVREAAERWPHWWNAELFGLPNRQDDVGPLCELDELLRHMRLVRRRGRRIVATARGRAAGSDPPALLVALASELLSGDGFRPACGELAVALVLDGAQASYTNAFADRLHPALVAEGWQAAGEQPSLNHVQATIADFLRPADAIGVLQRKPSGSRMEPDPLILTDAGRQL